jgi:hypothetical protein
MTDLTSTPTRSWLFTPATRPDRFEKASAIGADESFHGSCSFRVVHVPQLASVSAPAGLNRNRFDPTAEVEGRQHQTILSMAATMRRVRLRAKGIAR